MPGRRQSRKLVASTVLLACLTLAAQTFARAERLGGRASVSSSSERVLPAGWPGLLVRAQGTLLARSLGGMRFEDAWSVWAAPAPSGPRRGSCGMAGGEQGCCAMRRWMRACRGWAS